MASRRAFITACVRAGLLTGLVVMSGTLLLRPRRDDEDCKFGFNCGSCGKAEGCPLPEAVSLRGMVWQLDPAKCIQCGRCATECVLTPSAVKCTHAYVMCGYCDLCGGYFKPETKQLNTAAENQLCPTNALKRKYIEDPFYEYTVEEELCIGCAKCVKGCEAFGNGSLQLQIHHDRCVNCNECSIARVCPSEAFSRVPANKPYLMKGFGKERLDENQQQQNG
jgi:electron transport complex protein RnfB